MSKNRKLIFRLSVYEYYVVVESSRSLIQSEYDHIDWFIVTQNNNKIIYDNNVFYSITLHCFKEVLTNFTVSYTAFFGTYLHTHSRCDIAHHGVDTCTLEGELAQSSCQVAYTFLNYYDTLYTIRYKTVRMSSAK